MGFVASYIVIWVLTILLILIAIGLLRELTVLRKALLGSGGTVGRSMLVIGSRSPKFAGIDIRTGLNVTADALLGRPSTLIFLSPQCSVCRHLVSGLGSIATTADSPLRPIVVCAGTDAACRTLIKDDDLGSAVVLVDNDGRIAGLFGVSSYPVIVVIDAERRVLKIGYPRNAQDCLEVIRNALDKIGSMSTVGN